MRAGTEKQEEYFQVQLVLQRHWCAWHPSRRQQLVALIVLNGEESNTALWCLSRLPFSMSVMVAMFPHCTTFIHNFGLEEGALINSTDLVR